MTIVGNRLQRSSTLPAIPATGLLNYDANDRTATDPYDANGNLLNGGVGSNIYDFENHMVAAGGVTLAYDGDGNRVKETVAGVATSYLVADQNLTGYAQVMDELQGGAVSRTYSTAFMISQQRTLPVRSTTSFYGFDGHGSVRFLTSSTGAVTDTYDYDAFGNLISRPAQRRTTISLPASSSIQHWASITTAPDITTRGREDSGAWIGMRDPRTTPRLFTNISTPAMPRLTFWIRLGWISFRTSQQD